MVMDRCGPYVMIMRPDSLLRRLSFIRTWDEPRHAAVHPNNRWVYMCEEKGNKVLFFRFDDENGTFEALQELTTVPETVTGYSDASEVMVDPSGKFVLVSNRYTDSIAVYRIDPLTGYMRNVSLPMPGKNSTVLLFWRQWKVLRCK